MLNPELWATGSTAMAVGMGIVFSFLVILIFAISVMAKVVSIINKFSPVVVPEAKTTNNKTTDDADVALAIAVAMSQKV